jgi:DNA-binding XRE family transcriptional regulator
VIYNEWRCNTLNLKEQRIKKGMTQIDAAIAIGVSLSSYRMWELGVTKPNDTNMQKLIEVFGNGKSEKAI